MKAVLFDLDDTLFDHQYSRRCGLQALQTMYPELAGVSLNELEIEHERILLATYYHILDGSITPDEARVARIRLLGDRYGLRLNLDEARPAAYYYHNVYEAVRRAVPGIMGLLKYLAGKGLKTGVVTNGLLEAQYEKIRICGLGNLIGFILASESIGIRKPDPKIFKEALRLADAGPDEAIYIGDSWETDILGASGCGIKTLWLNRYGFTCPDSSITHEITSFIPLEDILTFFNK